MSTVDPAAAISARDRAQKFKGIYQALKEQDVRHAIRLCERKDIAQTPLAKALKASAYLMGQGYQEAAELARESLRGRGGAPVSDPGTLQAATKVLCRLGGKEEAIRAYEDAVAACPDSEPLLRGFCLTAVLAEDWKRLQAGALKLYAKHPKPAYMAWAALALHQTAGAGGVDEGKPAPHPGTGGGRGLGVRRYDGPGALNLTLAERYLAKALDAARAQDRDADSLGLYLHSLLRQGRAGDAYTALLGPYAYLPPSSSQIGTSNSEEDATAAEEEDAESALEMLGEDAGGVNVMADGHGGRGRVPGPLQPVDQLRYAAQILAWRAAWGPGKGEIVPLPTPVPACAEWVVCDPTQGHPIGSWTAALHAFGSLLGRVESSQGEWDAHAGLAYCWAQGAARRLQEDPVAHMSALLTPVTRTTSEGAWLITGLPFVDTLLSPFQVDTVANGTGNGGDTEINRRRCCMLALILHQAIRCELAHRLTSGGGLPDAVQSAASALLVGGVAVYMQLLAGFITTLGGKPAVFTDLKTLLIPLAPAATAASAVPPTPPASLSSFMSPEPTLLPLPFHPFGPVGSASETAPSRPLFSWSFSVPRAAVDAHLTPLLSSWRYSCLPDASLSSSVKAVLGEGRTAAVQAGLMDKTDVTVRTRDMAGAGRGARAYDPRTPPPSDPHGVAFALSAREEYVFTGQHKAALASARMRVRQYTTAMQLLRYTGRTDLQGCAAEGEGDHDERALPGHATPVPGEWAMRRVCNELACAWEHTLHLLAVSPSEAKDLGEGDDLLLLAVHGLWELSWAHMHARDSDGHGYGSGMFGGSLCSKEYAAACAAGGLSAEPEGGRAHLYAARSYVFEAASLLEAGVKHSAHNAQLRFALVRTYAWMGAPSAVMQHATFLRLRYIGQETLGWTSHMAFVRGRFGPMVETDKRVSSHAEMARYLSQAAGERPGFIRNALRAGNIASAADLCRMKSRLEQSASAAWARAVSLSVDTGDRANRLPKELREVLCEGATSRTSQWYTEDSATVLAGLRDNEERDEGANWTSSSGPGLAYARTGTLNRAAALARSGDASLAALVSACVGMFVDGAGGDEGEALALARCELTGWMWGSSGGQAERLLRRAARDVFISARAETNKALLYGLHVASMDGTPMSARAAVDRLAVVYALAGCVVPGARETAPSQATVDACSTVAGVFVESQKEGDEEGVTLPLIRLRLALVGDWANGSIPMLDTGLSAERPALRVACASASWRALAALACACEAAISADLAVTAKAQALSDAAAHVRIAGALGGSILTEIALACWEGAPVSAPLSHAASATAGAGAAADTPPSTLLSSSPATTALGCPALLDPMPSFTTGLPCSSSTGGGIRGAWGVEAALALHTLMPTLTIALTGVARHLASVSKDKEAAAGKGKGAGGKASAPDTGPTAALLSSCAALHTSLKDCVASLSTGLAALKASAHDVYVRIDTGLEKSVPYITAGWDVSACATTTGASMRAVVEKAGSSGGGDKKVKRGGTAAVPRDGTDPVPSDPAGAFIHSLNKTYRKAVRVDGIEGAVTMIGGAWTLGMSHAEEGVATRLAGVHALKALLKGM